MELRTGKEHMRVHRGGLGTASPEATSAHECKAAKTVGLVVGAFLVCWLPFFIFNLVEPWCRETCIRYRPFVNWLGFLNSAMNPFIYASNDSFKAAFARILCFVRNRRGGRGRRSATGGVSTAQPSGRLTSNLSSSQNEIQLQHVYF